MKKLLLLLLLISLVSSGQESQYPFKWPMYNDTNVNLKIGAPTYEANEGPLIMIDAAHKNFFIQSHLIKPLVDLLLNDGYRVSFLDKEFTKENLNQAKVLVVMTALPFDFATESSAANKSTFSKNELNELQMWVNNGGSLLVFSEHTPFDQAINPLLRKFEIESSIGYTIDTINYDKTELNQGMIIFEDNNLNNNHPIVNGKYKVKRLVSFGGSALTGSKYENILKLGKSSLNVEYSPDIGFEGKGNSQGIAGMYGSGKVAAFGDSNGFTAMIFLDDKKASLKDKEDITEKLSSLILDKEEYNPDTNKTEIFLGFKNITDDESFLNKYSDIKSNDSYVFENSFSDKVLPNIYKLKKGDIYGPYEDDDYMKVTKILDIKQMSDSVKVRHILVSYVGATKAGDLVNRTSSQAKKTADSIYNEIKINRNNFTKLLSLSSDKASNKEGGEYNFAYTDAFAPEFKDFSFENKVGKISVIESAFGFHVIEILSQTKKRKALKVANLGLRIVSPEKSKTYSGMNTKGYDWKNFVLNTFIWLSN